MGRKHGLVAQRGASLSSASVALFGLLAGGAQAAPKLEWLQTPKHTYVLLPPTIVADGEVRGAKWSTDGAYLLVAAAPHPTTVETFLQGLVPTGMRGIGGSALYVYERASGRARKVWELESSKTSVDELMWLPHSNTAYAIVEQRTGSGAAAVDTFGVLALDGVSGQFSWIPGMEHLAKEPTLSVSPVKPFAVAVFDDSPEELPGQRPGVAVATPTAIPVSIPFGSWSEPGADNYWTLGAGGAVIRRFHVDGAPWSGVTWGADGAQWYLGSINRTTKAKTWRQFGDDGKLTVVAGSTYVPITKVKPGAVASQQADACEAAQGFARVQQPLAQQPGGDMAPRRACHPERRWRTTFAQ